KKSGEKEFKCHYHAKVKKQNHNTKDCHELDALKRSTIEFEREEFTGYEAKWAVQGEETDNQSGGPKIMEIDNDDY
ncbi:hypothetical protein HDU76_009497, partial [Blyttiomyces sp. JEL0837]